MVTVFGTDLPIQSIYLCLSIPFEYLCPDHGSLYWMVTQKNMLHPHEGKWVYLEKHFRFFFVLSVMKCRKQIMKLILLRVYVFLSYQYHGPDKSNILLRFPRSPNLIYSFPFQLLPVFVEPKLGRSKYPLTLIVLGGGGEAEGQIDHVSQKARLLKKPLLDATLRYVCKIFHLFFFRKNV